ncbi:MAG: hypothetical protein JSW58_11325 [Candidatus Latescibacterota bacterium]|nr:MAG: hypothetical protein JSW58_11325 [Candidatus Latescibacterota bacterium]
MKRRVPLVLSMVLLVAIVWMLHTDAPSSIENKDVSITPPTEAGLKVHIDPATKEPMDGPLQPSLAIPPMEDPLNFSDEGLILEDSPVSGEMVNLQGRFRHRYTAAMGADGERIVGCDLHKSTEKENSDSEEE